MLDSFRHLNGSRDVGMQSQYLPPANGFTVFHNDFVFDVLLTLGKHALKPYLLLCARAYKKDANRIPIREIARLCGTTQRLVGIGLVELESLGLIRKIHHGNYEKMLREKTEYVVVTSEEYRSGYRAYASQEDAHTHPTGMRHTSQEDAPHIPGGCAYTSQQDALTNKDQNKENNNNRGIEALRALGCGANVIGDALSRGYTEGHLLALVDRAKRRAKDPAAWAASAVARGYQIPLRGQGEAQQREAQQSSEARPTSSSAAGGAPPVVPELPAPVVREMVEAHRVRHGLRVVPRALHQAAVWEEGELRGMWCRRPDVAVAS